MNQPSFTLAERLYKKAYSAAFWTENDRKRSVDSETTAIVSELAHAPLTLRQKAYILLGVCKIIASNGQILSGEVLQTWKSMNIAKPKPKRDPLQLAPRKSRTLHTLPENPLINLELEKDWPPYKLPKLAYMQIPSTSMDTIRSRDFPLDQTDSDYSSVTESMLSYQSDLFGDANQVLFDLTANENLEQATPIASPVDFNEAFPNEHFEPLDPLDPFGSFEPEIEDPEPAEPESEPEPRQKPKVTIQKEIFYSKEKLKEWFDTYKEFCEKATRPTKKETFERLFWGRETWSARQRRKRRDAEILKKNKAALLTPDQSSVADESPAVFDNQFDNQLDLMSDADNSDAEFDETPGSPMLELRKGEFENTLDTVGLLPESWDDLPPHPRLSESFQRDQNDLQGFLQKLSGQDGMVAGRVTEQDDTALLEQVNNLGGKCVFDQMHSFTRVSKGQAFYSMLRLAQQGKLTVNQQETFGQIEIQSSFRPH